MAKDITLNRDDAELLVDLLENNYESLSPVGNAGLGTDLASDIRELFGMCEQPDLKFKRGSKA